MSNKTPIPDFIQLAAEIKTNASRFAAVESVKFFKESFVKGGFTNSTFTKWKQSSSPLANKRTMQNTYKLMHSIRKETATLNKIVIIADSEYATIHNEGGTIIVTAQMKKFFWAKYYEFSGAKTRTAKTKAESKNKTNRSLNAKAEFCKRIALMKVGTKIKIPQRQFIGHSDRLMSSLDVMLAGSIKTQFQNQIISIESNNLNTI